jgi:uncharacterized protein (DUF2147 family)
MASPAVAAASPSGRWLTQDRGGVIEIFPCAHALCGRIAGLAEPHGADGSIPTDHAGKPKCGLVILRDVVESGAGSWNGLITNPDDGATWHCELWVDDRGRLRLRGYVLTPLFGETQVWSPYTGQLGDDCRMG